MAIVLALRWWVAGWGPVWGHIVWMAVLSPLAGMDDTTGHVRDLRGETRAVKWDGAMVDVSENLKVVQWVETWVVRLVKMAIAPETSQDQTLEHW